MTSPTENDSNWEVIKCFSVAKFLPGKFPALLLSLMRG